MKILNFGSLNIDHVYSVDHIVRPGETISCLGMQDFCGGKGLNQSIALALAGAQVYHAGKVGADGEELLRQMQNAGVNTTYTKIEDGVPTGHAIIQVDSKGQNCIVIHPGANGKITKEYMDEVFSNFEKGDMLLLQNEISNLEYAIEKAHEKGMKVALNPSPIDEKLASSSALQYVDYFVLNEIEGYEISGEKDGKAICGALRKKYPNCNVMLTLGKNGCMYHDGEVFANHGIYDVGVVDTTAAGDTFTGYFLACMAESLAVEKCLELASKASSMAVNKAGASSSIPKRAEVEATTIQLM